MARNSPISVWRHAQAAAEVNRASETRERAAPRCDLLSRDERTCCIRRPGCTRRRATHDPDSTVSRSCITRAYVSTRVTCPQQCACRQRLLFPERCEVSRKPVLGPFVARTRQQRVSGRPDRGGHVHISGQLHMPQVQVDQRSETLAQCTIVTVPQSYSFNTFWANQLALHRPAHVESVLTFFE